MQCIIPQASAPLKKREYSNSRFLYPQRLYPTLFQHYSSNLIIRIFPRFQRIVSHRPFQPSTFKRSSHSAGRKAISILGGG